MNLKQFVWSLLLMVLLQEAVVAQPSSNLTQTNSPSHPQQINRGEITTRQGVTYRGVVVQKVTPDGLVFQYNLTGGGMSVTKLKFKDLSDSVQQQFGYNPTNAAKFESDQRHAQGEWQAKWVADDQKARSARQKEEIADAQARAKWVGTGFFITENGYLLTCLHVVDDSTRIQVATQHGLFDAQLVKSDPDKDIALLKVTGTFSSLPLAASNSVCLGEAVFTIGFPRPTLQGWEPKLTRGEISSLSGFQDNTNEFQISVPTQPGNSGGALLDERGNVVGIVAAKLRSSEADIKERIAPENVNYAIKSSGVRTFLASVPQGWPLKLKAEFPPGGRNFGEVVQASQDAVVLVLVQ